MLELLDCREVGLVSNPRLSASINIGCGQARCLAARKFERCTLEGRAGQVSAVRTTLQRAACECAQANRRAGRGRRLACKWHQRVPLFELKAMLVLFEPKQKGLGLADDCRPKAILPWRHECFAKDSTSSLGADGSAAELSQAAGQCKGRKTARCARA